MVLSGLCAIATPLLFSAPLWLALPILLVWGFTVVADSAQFSALVTEHVDDTVRGTALTLQTALGFLLTLASIRLVAGLSDAWGWRWAFPILAAGPALGVFAMIRLAGSRRHSPSPRVSARSTRGDVL
jgi:MFS family permease